MFPGIHLNPYKKGGLGVFYFHTENFGFRVASLEKDLIHVHAEMKYTVKGGIQPCVIADSSFYSNENE